MREDCIYIDFCETHDCLSCPLDNLDNWGNTHLNQRKDRSVSRKRHHNKVKSKQRLKYVKYLQELSYRKARFAKKSRKRLKKKLNRWEAKRKNSSF